MFRQLWRQRLMWHQRQLLEWPLQSRDHNYAHVEAVWVTTTVPEIKMAMGNSSSGIDPPSPSPQGEIFPIPVPAKTIGGHLFPIPIPRGELVPDGDPHTRH